MTRVVAKKKPNLKLVAPEMVYIPEGHAILGISDEQVEYLLHTEAWAEEWYEKDMFMVEQPQHTIFLPAFEIGLHPVTNADYYIFIWETGYKIPRSWDGFCYPPETEDHPVVDVSQIDALAYCEWLSQRLGVKYRLPTEAEWERAARGDDDRIYPWGDFFDPWRCNTIESGRGGTTSVGIFSPSGDSPFGVRDMAGNVLEWTCSILKPYPYKSNDGRESIGSHEKYVVRGGSWYYSRKLARCTCREGVIATYFSPALGFRLARSV